jgi:hypothetical protein
MNKKHMVYATLILGAVSALTIALTLTVTRSRSSVAQGSVADSTLLAKTTSPQSNGAPAEAITVHGHWTIDVRNPDGSLVTHNEFENELANPRVLAMILTRSFTIGSWEVYVMPNNSGTPCGFYGNTGLPAACRLTESAQGTTMFPTLTVNNVDNKIVLSGTATAAMNGSIGKVATSVGVCSPATAPAACTELAYRFGSISVDQAYGGANMTHAIITPIEVVQDQIIQVTVKISFS